MPAPLYLAVIGASEADEHVAATAEQVGVRIGERGALLVCGGLGGVMEAACRGARSAGGTTIGYLPGTDRRDANPHLDIALPTGMGELRNGLIVRAADAVVAVGGEWGTLSEIGFALRLGRPVVGLGTWELARGGQRSTAIEYFDDPSAAVDRAIELARG